MTEQAEHRAARIKHWKSKADELSEARDAAGPLMTKAMDLMLGIVRNGPSAQAEDLAYITQALGCERVKAERDDKSKTDAFREVVYGLFESFELMLESIRARGREQAEKEPLKQPRPVDQQVMPAPSTPAVPAPSAIQSTVRVQQVVARPSTSSVPAPSALPSIAFHPSAATPLTRFKSEPAEPSGDSSGPASDPAPTAPAVLEPSVLKVKEEPDDDLLMVRHVPPKVRGQRGKPVHSTPAAPAPTPSMPQSTVRGQQGKPVHSTPAAPAPSTNRSVIFSPTPARTRKPHVRDDTPPMICKQEPTEPSGDSSSGSVARREQAGTEQEAGRVEPATMVAVAPQAMFFPSTPLAVPSINRSMIAPPSAATPASTANLPNSQIETPPMFCRSEEPAEPSSSQPAAKRHRLSKDEVEAAVNEAFLALINGDGAEEEEVGGAEEEEGGAEEEVGGAEEEEGGAEEEEGGAEEEEGGAEERTASGARLRTCGKCRNSFVGTPRAHELEEHAREEKKCEQCGLSFPTRELLQSHLVMVNSHKAKRSHATAAAAAAAASTPTSGASRGAKRGREEQKQGSSDLRPQQKRQCRKKG